MPRGQVGTIEVTAFQARDTSSGAEADAGEGGMSLASLSAVTITCLQTANFFIR